MKKLTIWNIVILVLSLGSLLLLYSKGCPKTEFAFAEKISYDTCNTCDSTSSNETCSSPSEDFVCTENRKLFRSPCRAGCPDGTLTDCSCAMMFNTSSTVTKGLCPATKECGDYFFLFGFMLVFFPCLLASGPFGVSKYLTIMRSVEDRDKEVAIMLAQVGGQLLALIPSPPFFGFLLDKSCVYKGGVKCPDGVCSLYDKELMKRDFYLGLAILVFMVLLLEVLIYWQSHKIQLYDEPSSDKDTEAGGNDKKQQEAIQM